jgi:hypothetical protein
VTALPEEPQTVSRHPVERIAVQAAREQGWDVSYPGEAEVAHQLGLLGYTPRDVETQFKLGPYRLDFAIPAERIDIEADGWVHGTRQVSKRDAGRDRKLKEWGWVVVRIDTEEGDASARLRRHIPNRSRLAGYGEIFRRVDAIFKMHLDRLQRREGVTDPEEVLKRMSDALYEAARGARLPCRIGDPGERSGVVPCPRGVRGVA